MITSEELYTNKIFLNSVLPLVKVIIESRENLSKKFKGKNGRVQISALDSDGKVGTHYIIKDGSFTVVKGIIENPNIELEFKSIPALNNFFAGKSKKLPKIKGWYHLGLLISTLSALMTMAKLLGAIKAPAKKEDKELLVKLLFYLLSSGISQLNKTGHPKVSSWVKKSPDRVYAWTVNDKPELSAYIRVKAGKSKAARGVYRRSKPFFSMRFDNVDSALGILLETDDMIESTASGKLMMEGAPEYGAQLGEYMLLVGSFAK
ncbi:hypothetical protein [Chengkuizengella sediminis]|uniref:hypothetical protein n=1 Tax=Chengkuizengella sediminis TaxID=1885917 RepID=UPI00138A5A68|nr:hypothetical protein [Chengkuizengella sediminis]NDI34979.1 hypothetical protein [Chengkuizengella sediminis]